MAKTETPEEYNNRIDAENATRTSKYDQDLKERARALSINPDNFGSEQLLAETVEEQETKLKNEVKGE